MQRYFFSRKRDGSYRIMDRKLETHIAKTDWREAAVLITQALNERGEQMGSMKELTEPKSKSASSFGLAPILEEGRIVCSFCRFPPSECICK